MPRYFFHTADGSSQRDDEGLELVDSNAARREAIRFAGAMLNEDPELIWAGRDFRVQVTDATKRLVVTVVMLAIDAPPLR